MGLIALALVASEPRHAHRVRSSHDFACCARTTESARSKYPSAFPASDVGDFSAIAPAVR